MRISTKSAQKICSVIRKKPLVRARRLLQDLSSQKRSLKGKYYTKTVNEILELLKSCEKNAEFLGLDAERLFVHASAHKGTILRRRRRKAAFGARMKSTNMEIMLIERGKSEIIKTKKPQDSEAKKEHEQVKKKLEEVKEKTKEIKEAVQDLEKEAANTKKADQKEKGENK